VFRGTVVKQAPKKTDSLQSRHGTKCVDVGDIFCTIQAALRLLRVDKPHCHEAMYGSLAKQTYAQLDRIWDKSEDFLCRKGADVRGRNPQKY